MTRPASSPSVTWLVSFWGGKEDVERVLASGLLESFDVASADGKEVVISFEVDAVVEDDVEFAWVLRGAVESLIERVNSVLKLLHGYDFDGLRYSNTAARGATGEEKGFVWIGLDETSLDWDRYARDKQAKDGKPPPRPSAIDEVGALDVAKAGHLATYYPMVARGLHLLGLALSRDAGFDWSAAYSAIEIVKEAARLAGVDGEERGWWTKSELKAFEATANNPRLVGHKARHGKMFTAAGQLMALPRTSMDAVQAGWFVRGVYARWMRDLAAPPPAASQGG